MCRPGVGTAGVSSEPGPPTPREPTPGRSSAPALLLAGQVRRGKQGRLQREGEVQGRPLRGLLPLRLHLPRLIQKEAEEP